ncbi:hypothetical protein HZF24_04790 [Sedimentibacter hydroxybenzoicus DSM 7310]|uniref:Uncharacterized protein n=2 Tax=Sedimentibacter hydroxybenzoicus TaxID=29345 RepID=A0A974BIH2_SEDHY|nr:hypothetical protein [Sedimentibacter hydroxybenzoicus DSM 7310]
MVENSYFEACGIQSAEYQWFMKLEKNNIFVRLFKEVIKILYDMIIAILILFGFLIYVYIYFKLTGTLNLDFIDDYIGGIFMFMIITVLLFCILLATNEYAVIKSTNSPKSKLNLLLRKKLPKYFNWWDGLFKIKKKQKYNYPEMYKGDICK